MFYGNGLLISTSENTLAKAGAIWKKMFLISR